MASSAIAGRLTLARNYVESLPIWFASHLATMDAALAGCLKRMVPELSARPGSKLEE